MTGGTFSVSGEFTAYTDVYDDGHWLHFTLEWVGSPMSFDDALAMMKWNENFTSFLSALIAQSGFEGLVWECPPLTRSNLSRQFEFVVIDTRQPYHSKPDPSSFRSYLEPLDGRESLAIFKNLGGDASLVIPSWVEGTDYRDLLHFLKTASSAHKHILWQGVSSAVQECMGDRPTWLSVAGAGEPWLHVRLDTRPKYYQHTPYRKERPA